MLQSMLNGFMLGLGLISAYMLVRLFQRLLGWILLSPEDRYRKRIHAFFDKDRFF